MLKIFILFFILNFYNIVFSSEKEKIITKMQNTNNLSFNFVQTISEKKENGNCIIKYPKKIYCEYDNHDKKIIADLENYFTVNTTLDTDTQILVNQYYELVIKELVELNPKWIGFSVFTFQCQRACTEILQRLRSRYKGRIMIGGAGISTRGIASSNADYANKLMEEGLIDAYIKGDGDIALIELMKNNFDYAGINGNPYAGVPDLNVIPKPDWSDVIDLPYRYHNRKI